jgi:hypothetical protein
MRERSRDLEGRRTLAPRETAIVLLLASVDGDVGFCDETEAGCRHADRSAWAVKAGEELIL